MVYQTGRFVLNLTSLLQLTKQNSELTAQVAALTAKITELQQTIKELEGITIYLLFLLRFLTNISYQMCLIARNRRLTGLYNVAGGYRIFEEGISGYFIEGDFLSCPDIKGKGYDVVLSLDVIEHIDKAREDDCCGQAFL